MGEHISFPSNGTTGQGYLATPKSGSGPPVIVIQEWWGLVDHIVNVCDRLAGAGYLALAPDLYRGKTVTEPDEAAKAMMAMEFDRAARDMSGAVDELCRRSSRDAVGVIGFCMGGGLALVLGCHRPDVIKAVVPCYGVIPWPDAQPDYAKMTAAVDGHFADRDTFFTPDAAVALGEELRALGLDASITVHANTDHAFFNDDRPEVYSPAASAAVWKSALALFSTHLN